MNNSIRISIVFLISFHFLCFNRAFSQWTNTTNYSISTTYNIDGGITSLSRNSTLNFDNLTYNFNDGAHQLNHVDDAKTASVYGYDIADQTKGNYKYDASGNLISNIQDTLSITYNSLGKIEKITKTSGESTIYTYDAAGNKIKKINTNSSGEITNTYYFLDALGKEINVYESTSSASDIKSIEAVINGAEQEGSIANNSTTVSSTTLTNIYTRTLGKKSFYHKDHLGSIRTTYTDNTKTEKDKIMAIATCENTYPYGMAQPLRTYNATETRKGFQGKEAENALASNKTVLDFCARYNDTQLGLWMGVDALEANFSSISPYNSMSNNPINYIDPNGMASMLAISLGNDVKYRSERLASLTQHYTNSITSINVSYGYDDASTQMDNYTIYKNHEMFIQALVKASREEDGIGYLAVFSHANSIGLFDHDGVDITIAEFEELIFPLIKNGEIKFVDDALVYFGGCNFGNDLYGYYLDQYGSVSIPQRLANVSGASVVAAINSKVAPLNETGDEQSYSAFQNYEGAGFYMFKPFQDPLYLGKEFDVMAYYKQQADVYDPINRENRACMQRPDLNQNETDINSCDTE